MKAYVLNAINDFTIQTVEQPVPQEGEVLVKVKAAGICGSDIPRIYSAGTYHYPLIPGHEFAGEVVAVGKNVTASWINKAVGIYPLIPCKECAPCSEGQYELCRHYSYLGSRRDGGFAEYVRVPEWNLIELPNTVTYQQAAMMEPLAVAVHALRRANPKPSDKVVVCGLGTIGLFLTMFLLDANIEHISVIGNKKIQQEKAIELGINPADFCNQREQDPEEWIARQTNGLGADVYFDCVGKNSTLLQAISQTAPNGIIQVVGNPNSDMVIDKNIYWKILRNQLTVKGSWNSSFTHSSDDDWHYVLNRLSNGAISPERFITHQMGMQQMLKGFEIMRDKSEEYIKIMGSNLMN